jgi:hypothetical protein
MREEVQTVSEATKKTWAQVMEEQITARVKRQFEERWMEHLKTQEENLKAQEENLKAQEERFLRQQKALNDSRAKLIMRLSASFGILPESVIADVNDCEDAGRLEAALLRTPSLKSQDDFKLLSS